MSFTNYFKSHKYYKWYFDLIFPQGRQKTCQQIPIYTPKPTPQHSYHKFAALEYTGFVF